MHVCAVRPERSRRESCAFFWWRDARGARYDHSVCKSLVAIVYMRAMILILRRPSARHIREKRLQHEEDGDEGLHAE